MLSSLQVYHKFSKISGEDFSQSRLDVLGFKEVDLYTDCLRPLPAGVQALFLDQPDIVENISLELVILPLEFEMTPEALLSKFEFLWERQEVTSTRNLMFGGLFGAEIVIESPFMATKMHEVFLWVFTGKDEEFQYAIKFHRDLTLPEHLENTKQDLIKSASKVLKRQING